MSCTDCASNEIKYVANGVLATPYPFPFVYLTEDDVYVELYNFTTKRWDNVPQSDVTYPWKFENATTIKFTTTAPPVPPSTDPTYPNIKIARCTDIDPLEATFYPGSAIRAQDLNNNFEQLQMAIQEGRCQVPDGVYDYLDKYYWNKLDETTYTTSTWATEATDAFIPTTGAVNAHIATELSKEDLQVVCTRGSTTTTGATFGSGNITLSADGSATFVGTIDAGASDLTSYALFIQNNRSDRSTIISKNFANGNVFEGRDGSNAGTSFIKNDGTATFAGNVFVGDDPNFQANSGNFFGASGRNINRVDSDVACYTLYRTTDTNPRIQFSGNGSATFTGFVDCTRNAADGFSYLGVGPGGTNEKALFVNRSGEITLELYSNYSGSPTVLINSAGNASFSGKLTSASTVAGDGGTTLTTKDYIDSLPSGGVTQITAGTNVTISPTSGVGNVTINATGGGSGATNLGINSRNANTLDVTSSTGTNATIPAATTTLAGLLSASDKVILGGLSNPLLYQGTVNLTSATIPGSPLAGWTYANIITGTCSAEWGAVLTDLSSGDAVTSGDLVVYNGTDWTHIPTGGQGATQNLQQVTDIGSTTTNSATFGTIDITKDGVGGCEVRNDGLVRAQRPSNKATSAVFQGWCGTDLVSPTSQITANGSASFGGTTNVKGSKTFESGAPDLAGTYSQAAFRIQTASNSSNCIAIGPRSTDGSMYLQGTNNPGNAIRDLYLQPYGGALYLNNQKISLNDNGSAEFDGTVDVARINLKGTSTENILAGYAGSTVNSVLTADAQAYLGNISGGGNIFLDGTDGSASFAGNIQGKNPRSNTAGEATGGLSINPSDSTQYYNFRVDVTDNKLNIDTPQGAGVITFGIDGSADFAGNVKTGNGLVTTGDPGAQINANGQISSSRVVSGAAVDGIYIQTAPNNSTAKTKVFNVKTDGSASFGGLNIGSAASTGTQIYKDLGQVIVTTGDNNGLSIYKKGVSAIAIDLNANGSAQFAAGTTRVNSVGSFLVGTTSDLVTDAKIAFDAGSGDATFKGEINTNNTDGVTSNSCVSIKNSRVFLRNDGGTSSSNAVAVFKGGGDSEDIVAAIKGDGSCQFAAGNAILGVSANTFKKDVTITNGTGSILLKDDGSASFSSNIDCTGLPTSDPGVSGRLWNDSGTLKISS